MSRLKQAKGKMQEEYKREINGKPILNASIAIKWSEECGLFI